MGTYIDAACAQAGNGRRKATARRLADDAARACFARAGCRPSDVDMLINVGVYRQDNMGEPALAALIQEDIGANLGHPPTGGSGSFSFDLLNGACGVITAVQIESGLLQSGVIQLGAVVSSDVQPELENPGAHFLQPAGGAMLLRWDDRLAGFTDFCTQTFPEYEDLFTSGLVWQERCGIRAPRQGTGRHRMAVSVKPGYQARLVDCAEDATRQTLFFKFTAAPESVYIFTKVGAEPWGRIGSGILELIAALLLIWPRFPWAGAAIALGVMAGAILSHLTVLGIEVQGDHGLLFALAVTVLTCSAGVLWLYRAQLPIVGGFFQ